MNLNEPVQLVVFLIIFFLLYLIIDIVWMLYKIMKWSDSKNVVVGSMVRKVNKRGVE